MNQLLEDFKSHFKNYYKLKENAQHYILAELRQYANQNPEKFKAELKEIWFDWKIMPLDFVTQALAKEVKDWEDFFVETLKTFVKEAKQSNNPKRYLSVIGAFAYIEMENKAFGQQIVAILEPELDSINLPVRLAAIENLSYYYKNPFVVNKDALLEKLQSNLYNPNWKVRVVAFNYLGYEDLLPDNYTVRFPDLLRKWILGTPKS